MWNWDFCPMQIDIGYELFLLLAAQITYILLSGSPNCIILSGTSSWPTLTTSLRASLLSKWFWRFWTLVFFCIRDPTAGWNPSRNNGDADGILFLSPLEWGGGGGGDQWLRPIDKGISQIFSTVCNLRDFWNIMDAIVVCCALLAWIFAWVSPNKLWHLKSSSCSHSSSFPPVFGHYFFHS